MTVYNFLPFLGPKVIIINAYTLLFIRTFDVKNAYTYFSYQNIKHFTEYISLFQKIFETFFQPALCNIGRELNERFQPSGFVSFSGFVFGKQIIKFQTYMFILDINSNFSPARIIQVLVKFDLQIEKALKIVIQSTNL